MLNDKQLQAIDLMVNGWRFTEIEEAIGVSHTQLWRWRTADPEFATGLAQARAVSHQKRVEKLWRIVDRAMDVSLDTLDEGDPVMARDVLRMTWVGLSLNAWARRAEASPTSGSNLSRRPTEVRPLRPGPSDPQSTAARLTASDHAVGVVRRRSSEIARAALSACGSPVTVARNSS